MPPQLPPLAYSLDQIGQVAPLGRSTVKQLIEDGELPRVKSGKRVMVLHEDLLAYLRAHREILGNGKAGVPPDEEPPPPPPSSGPRRRGRPAGSGRR